MTAQAEKQTGIQYLTFTVRDEAYAVDILNVREVMDISELTRLPGMPEFMDGVINLREQVVPVIDLGQKLGMAKLEEGKKVTIIIFLIERGGKQGLVGALVDKVEAVMNISPRDIEPAPHFQGAQANGHILGMANQGKKFLILVDIQKILGDLADKQDPGARITPETYEATTVQTGGGAQPVAVVEM